MKGLKKIALATAVAAAPFAAQADLKALDDTTMGNVTGQAGVTIELETEVSIGGFRYTDEGYLAVNDISIGGGSVEPANEPLRARSALLCAPQLVRRETEKPSPVEPPIRLALHVKRSIDADRTV